MYMRTTIDLPEDLALSAKMTAIERRTTLRNLVIAGLKREIEDPSPQQHADPLNELKGLGASVWKKVDPEMYVAKQRKGWE